MSDDETRVLERSDDLDAEVALLHRQLRDGTMTRERVRLMAYCGHAAATVIEPTAPYRPKDAEEFVDEPSFADWFDCLHHWPGAQKLAAAAAFCAVYWLGWSGHVGDLMREQGTYVPDAWRRDPRAWTLACVEVCQDYEDIRPKIREYLIKWDPADAEQYVDYTPINYTSP